MNNMNIQNTQTQKKTPQQILEEIKQKALAIQSGLSNQSQTQTTPQAMTITPRAEAFNKYAEAHIPTQEEKDYQSRISSIMGKREATDIRVGDEPISAQAMAGRREMLTREEQAQLVPMQRQLAILQGQRQASLDTQKLRYEEEKSKEESKGKTVTVGKSLYQYDPATNSYKLAVEGPKEYQSGSIGEYEYYRDNEIAAGRKPMGYNEYQTLDANRKRSIVNNISDDTSISEMTTLDIASPTYMDDLFKSNIGGKKPTQVETLRPIQKTMSVVNQLGELSSLIKNTKTDPIIGTLKSMNPYDFDARAIQATLQATVPNLARGVYGEVGVLTDNDIRNYIKTLPNIKGTEKQNKFVMGMTLRSLQNGLLGQLEILQGAGYDISGFKNSYDKLLKKIDEIENTLGIRGTQNNEEVELLNLGYSPEQIEQIKSAQ